MGLARYPIVPAALSLVHRPVWLIGHLPQIAALALKSCSKLQIQTKKSITSRRRKVDLVRLFPVELLELILWLSLVSLLGHVLTSSRLHISPLSLVMALTIISPHIIIISETTSSSKATQQKSFLIRSPSLFTTFSISRISSMMTEMDYWMTQHGIHLSRWKWLHHIWPN